ncbi:MAG TPA: hypothetical protein VKF59_07770 [Candidatus Dormibacteraeota bacterium]|nr:hypothetical protein [Candidatus Dormibacteraeota bacterium]
MKRKFAVAREVLVVGGALAFGVVAWEHWLHAHLLGRAGMPDDSLRHWLRDSLMALPVGLASAVIARLWARVLRLRQGAAGLLARGSLASVIFAALLVPSAPVHNQLDAAFDTDTQLAASGQAVAAELGAGPSGGLMQLETDTSLTGQALHGVHDALLGEVVALPLAAGALLLLALPRLRPRPRGPVRPAGAPG